jgi:hypothetical protein
VLKLVLKDERVRKDLNIKTYRDDEGEGTVFL